MALAGSMERLDAELTEPEAEECLHAAEQPTTAAADTSWISLLRVLYDSLKRSTVVGCYG